MQARPAAADLRGLVSKPAFTPTSSLRRSFGVAATIFVVVSLALVVLRAAGADVIAMLRDPAATPPNGSALRGALSDFGVLVMTATGALALLGAAGLPAGPERRLLFNAGLFAGTFALDDALMVHEGLGDAWSWLPAVVYGPLIALLGVSLVRWSGERRPWPLIVVCVLFALSLAIDVTFDMATLHPLLSALPFTVRAVAEDVAKLDGILCFAALFVPLSVAALRHVPLTQHAPTH